MAANIFIQWKNTDACLDFYCECGQHGHYDDYFAYGLQCSHCKRIYTVPVDMPLTLGVPDNGIVQTVPMDED